jgi:prefoldin subunit 5
LSDTQSKLAQAEAELAGALDNLRKRDHDRGTVSKEVDMLKNDIQIMKSQLAQIDQEKDELLVRQSGGVFVEVCSNDRFQVALDDKTEKLATMEHDLRSRDKTIASLESMLNELKKKLR